MKAYILQVLIIDHDEVGAEQAASEIENARYSNRCIMPRVLPERTRTADLGEWTDEHPLNDRHINYVELDKHFP